MSSTRSTRAAREVSPGEVSVDVSGEVPVEVSIDKTKDEKNDSVYWIEHDT